MPCLGKVKDAVVGLVNWIHQPLWLVSRSWWKCSLDLAIWLDLARCHIHLRNMVEICWEIRVRVRRYHIVVRRAFEFETTSPMPNWSDWKILCLAQSELLLGTMLSCCIRALNVPQGLISLSDVNFCVVMDVGRHVWSRLLLLHLALVLLYLSWLATCNRWLASTYVDLLHLVYRNGS